MDSSNNKRIWFTLFTGFAVIIAVLTAGSAVPALAVSLPFNPSTGNTNGFVPQSSDNPPWGIHLTFPDDPRYNIAVLWFTDKAPTDPSVIYGTVSGNPDMSVSASVTPLGDVYICKAVLGNLKPDTDYYYKVGSTTDGYSPEYKFTTAPERGNKNVTYIHFAVFGDTRTNRVARRTVRDMILNKSMEMFGNLPSFIINVGDIVQDGEILEQWLNYFRDMEPLFTYVPIVPVQGNHEFGGFSASWYPEMFILPDVAGTVWYYSLNWGTVHLAALDSETHGIPPFDQFSDRWLEFDLSTADSDPSILWKYTYFHQPIYTSGGHEEREDLRLTWAPLFDKYGVDTVFSGHNHNYERIYPINAERQFIKEKYNYTNLDRPIYIISGCGAMGNPSALPSENRSYSVLFNASWHYCDINITMDYDKMISTMTVTVIATADSESFADAFILDNFTVTKTIPSDFGPPPAGLSYKFSEVPGTVTYTVITVVLVGLIAAVNAVILLRRKKALTVRK